MKKNILLFCFLLYSFNSFSQHINVAFPSDTFTLAGTLSIPQGTGPFPVIVLVHGSGPNDRDQTLTLSGGNFSCLYPSLVNKTIKNFKDIATSFSSRGYAVLRYDKRSLTHGSKLDPKKISPYDFVTDIHSAVEFVKTRTEIDTSCIILLGHSQGGNFIPIVAKQRNDISVLLSLGTGGQGIDSIIAIQGRDIYYKCLKDTSTGNSHYAKTLSDFGKIRKRTWGANNPYSGIYPKFWEDWIDITDSSIINYQTINTPTLLLHATEDFNIPMTSAKRFENQVKRNGFDLFYMNGLNHYFTNSSDPSVHKSVVDTMVYWLKNNKVKNSLSQLNSQVVSYSLLDYSEKLIIKFEVEENVNLQLLNMEGRVISKFHNGSTNEIRISKEYLANGIYILKGQVSQIPFSRKIVIRG